MLGVVGWEDRRRMGNDDWEVCQCVVPLRIDRERHRQWQHDYLSLVLWQGVKQHVTVLGQVQLVYFMPQH